MTAQRLSRNALSIFGRKRVTSDLQGSESWVCLVVGDPRPKMEAFCPFDFPENRGNREHEQQNAHHLWFEDRIRQRVPY